MKYLDEVDIAAPLSEVTRKLEEYGGYTLSNLDAPPMYVGGFRDDPQERNYVLILVVPDRSSGSAKQSCGF